MNNDSNGKPECCCHNQNLDDVHDEDFGLWFKVVYAGCLLITAMTAILAYEDHIPKWIPIASALIAGVIFAGWLALKVIDCCIYLLSRHIQSQSSRDSAPRLSPSTHGEWLLVVIGVGIVIWLIRVIF